MNEKLINIILDEHLKASQLMSEMLKINHNMIKKLKENINAEK